MNLKINGVLYPATFAGKENDRDWDGRASKAITMTGTYAAAAALFADGTAWSIVSDPYAVPVLDETGEPTGATAMQTDEYDNGAYAVLGDITVHTDGTVTVRMGRPTELEEAYELLYGGESV